MTRGTLGFLFVILGCVSAQDCVDSAQSCVAFYHRCQEQQIKSLCKVTCNACDGSTGTWTDWTDWGLCNVQCGIGEQMRTRNCQGTGCSGDAFQTQACSLPACPPGPGCSDSYPTCPTFEHRCDESSIRQVCKGTCKACNGGGTGWSSCSKTCGGGTQKRYHCEGADCKWEFKACGTDDCLTSVCSVLNGLQYRYKSNHECCKSQHIPSGYTCGRPTNLDRIIGGVNAKSKQWPWLVAFEVISGADSSFCSGFIISPNYILTAAHCVANKQKQLYDIGKMIVYSGLLQLSEIGFLPQRGIKMKTATVHPNYNGFFADIALVELESNFVYGDTVKAICLPMGEETPFDSTCHIAGWGVSSVADTITNHLQEADVLNFNPDACIEAYAKLDDTKGRVPYLKATKDYLCAGSLDKAVDSCAGDSGSPLVAQRCDSCTWYAAGISSFGPDPCASVGAPGIYTKLTYYEDWILGITGLTKYQLSCSSS